MVLEGRQVPEMLLHSVESIHSFVLVLALAGFLGSLLGIAWFYSFSRWGGVICCFLP